MGGQQWTSNHWSLYFGIKKAVSACNRLLLMTEAEPVLLTEAMYAEEKWWESDLMPMQPTMLN